MLILVKNVTTVAGLNRIQKDTLYNNLSIPNPKYIQAVGQGRPSYWIPQKLTYALEEGGRVTIPVGYTEELTKLFACTPEDIVDVRTEGTPMTGIQFKGTLRPYQQQVIDTMSGKTLGVVCAPTGSGKSVVIVNHIVKSGHPTLILVNTIELMNQMIDNVVKFTNIKKEAVGILGNGEWKIRPITVATLQTMTKLSEDKYKLLNEIFGQIITDEVHIVAAESFYSVLQRLNAKYKWGFSATPKRDDSLTPVIFWATGPLIHEVSLSSIKDKLVIPTIRQIKTDYYFPLFNSDEYIAMVNDLCEDKDRNKLILDTVDEYKDKQIVILTQRVTHAVQLCEGLRNKNYEAEYLVSRLPHPDKPGKFKAMNKKTREKIIETLNSGMTRIVCSTFGLFSTGIDISGLEILFIAAPTRSEIKLKQSLGRIFRKAAFEKSPVVVDFLDHKVDLLKSQGYARNRIYKYLKEI